MCGLVAVYCMGKNTDETMRIAIRSVGRVKHRGQQGAGVCGVSPDGTVLHHSAEGPFDAAIKPTDIEKLGVRHRVVMAECRWATYGGYHLANVQPVIVTSPNGIPVIVIHNGQFILMPDLLSQRDLTDSIESDTLLFTRLLARYVGENWEDHVTSVISKAQGAFSLAISINGVLYVARDEYGIRPLYLGQRDGLYIAASETQAITAVGGTVIREIGCGEILKIDTDGLHVLVEGNGQQKHVQRHVCEFESAYLCRPDSMMQPLNDPVPRSHSRFRYELGEVMAKEAPVPQATMIVGVPDSGIPFALGYAFAMGVKYVPALVRERDTSSRLFMDDEDLAAIGLKVLSKISPVPDPTYWEGARVVFCDDSTVRANVSMALTKLAFSLGATEVHVRLSFPWIKHPCPFGTNTRTYKELIAAQFPDEDTEKMVAKHIGATSVRYISPEGFLRVLLNGKVIVPDDPRMIFVANGGCGYCVTGKSPMV